jgi:hypothetical protein
MSISPFGTQKNFGISDSLLDAVRGVVKGQPEEEQQEVVAEVSEVEQELEEKKLDPVGQEDGDVDNDGDKDSSDEYLMKRRKAIGKAMKGKKDEVDTDPKLDEAVNMDKVRRTYSGIMKGGRQGPPDDSEVGDYIPKGMTKADIAALIKMLAKQGYDAKFLTKDLAPLAEENIDEAMRVLAKKGKTQVVTKGDGLARVMVGGKEVASGDLDDLAGGWFMSRPGEKGSKFFDSPQKIADFYKEEVEVEEGLEDNKENPANSQHLCAKQVVHESWGEGTTIRGEHADPDEAGNIAWYDVMFGHGIERQVSIDEMKVTKAESHMNHKKKKMSEETLSEAPFMNHGSEAVQHRELSDKHRKFAEKARKEGNFELAKKHDMASQKHKEAMNHQNAAERERQDGGSDRNPTRLKASQKSMDAHKFGKSVG